MTELISVINSFQKLDVETEQAIEKYFVEEKFLKNEFIIYEGKISSKIYFIKSGLIRRFNLRDGIEVTKWIYTDNQFVTSLSSFFEQKPSFESFQASEDTVVYSLSYEHEQILLEYPLFSKFHVKLLRLYLSRLNEFHHFYTSMNAQEKYFYLLKSLPQIVLKAKLKDIASLSRIRAQIN